MTVHNELTIGLLAASWCVWLANLAAILWLKGHRQKLWRMTTMGFTLSSFAVAMVTVVDLSLIRG